MTKSSSPKTDKKLVTPDVAAPAKNGSSRLQKVDKVITDSSGGLSAEKQPATGKQWKWFVLLPCWVLVSFVLSQVVVGVVLGGLNSAGVLNGLDFDSPVFATVLTALVYVVMFGLMIFLPFWLRIKTDRKELGLMGLPTWTDTLLAPAGFVVYMVLSVALILLCGVVMPWIDVNQAQDVAFTAENLRSGGDFVLAFLSLVVLAPVLEEVMLRGWLFGKLRKLPINKWLVMTMVSVVFGIMHGQWNVGINVFAMSFVMCFLREITGTIYAGMILHMIKNAVAFYLLFVNPSLVT
ncbi:MAG: CPBP family intramembrane metalloprotease [Candidatus Nomurabacteria bacterium]|jgi:membrane protease YdiL (CAAX protease family)|nr:CPBP family intramembrane metalloprotease [Candidatus Nomurabacteria bacterium]